MVEEVTSSSGGRGALAFAVWFACAVASCATNPASHSRLEHPERYGGGDGLTCSTRVIVHADNEHAGADAEFQWLLAKYPGHQRGTQTLGKCGESPVDIIRIQTADGRSVDVTFDIFEYYGRF